MGGFEVVKSGPGESEADVFDDDGVEVDEICKSVLPFVLFSCADLGCCWSWGMVMLQSSLASSIC